jgi:hypothetical protein
MCRLAMTGILAMLVVGLAGRAAAQESKAAATTRKNLQQKVSMNLKEVGLKAFLETELNNEVDKPLRFKIDNGSGVSNNMKVSYSGKDVTVEKLLNELSDKYEFGYYVISNAANNKEDGKVVIRKSSKAKERGYEAGKEPKKDASLAPTPWPGARPQARLAVFAAVRLPASLVHNAFCCYGPKGG